MENYKQFFEKGKVYYSRIGEYKVTFINEEGMKIQYKNFNKDWIEQFPNKKFRTRQFITDGFNILHNAHINILAERGSCK